MDKVEIIVHERITQRHPEISTEDVTSAFRNVFRFRQRPTGEYIAIGTDSRSRLIELVYIENLLENCVLIYHAQTPPTQKTNAELDLRK